MEEIKATVILSLGIAGTEDETISVKIPCVIEKSEKDLTYEKLITTNCITGISIEPEDKEV